MREFHHSRVLHSFDVSASRLCLWPPFMRHPRHKATSQIPEIYRGTEFAVIFLPKIKVEVMVPASLVDAIVKAARMARSVTARFSSRVYQPRHVDSHRGHRGAHCEPVSARRLREFAESNGFGNLFRVAGVANEDHPDRR